MDLTATIAKVHGRQIWDSRGRPTLEVDIWLTDGSHGRGVAPAGASRGSAEAIDLRDGGTRLGGYGIQQALAIISEEIGPDLLGRWFESQEELDQFLINLDGTPNKARLGGNSLIAVSLAFAQVQAAQRQMPLWQWLSSTPPAYLPLPEIQLFGGGAHAAGRVDIQDFMLIAVGAETFSEALEWTAEVYRAAGCLLRAQGRLAGVADEGGWWPQFSHNEEGLEWSVRAIEKAGFQPGRELALSLDVAASEFRQEGRYQLRCEQRELEREELLQLLNQWLQDYPIVSLEDPLGEDDDWSQLIQRLHRPVQVIGDDYLVTQAKRVVAAAKAEACNALLVKPNQVGTLTETKAALEAAHAAGWQTVVSARSGETEDVSMVHLAVGWGASQLKVGSFARSERMAKWNETLRVGEAIGTLRLPPHRQFPWNAHT